MSTTARFSLADYDQMIARGLFEQRAERHVELIRGALREMNLEVTRDPASDGYRSVQTVSCDNQVTPLSFPQ